MERSEFEKYREIILAFLQAKKFEQALEKISFLDACCKLYRSEIDLLRFQVVSAWSVFGDGISSYKYVRQAAYIEHNELREALARQMLMWGLLKKDKDAAYDSIRLLPIAQDLPSLYLHVRALMIELDCSSKVIEGLTDSMISAQRTLLNIAMEKASTAIS